MTKKLEWVALSWLMLTDVVGTSVLTLAGVAATLGWVPLIGMLLIGLLVSIYTAVLLMRTALIVESHTGHRVHSMGEAARITLGGDWAARVVYTLVYGNAVLGNASYLLVLGKNIQGALYDIRVCLPAATALACGALLPFVVGIQRLIDSVLLCFLNFFLILGVLVLCEVELVSQGRAEIVYSPLFGQDLNFVDLFGATTNILYAFGGHWVYLELIASMRKPAHFYRCFYINAPLQLGLYLLVGASGYYYQGTGAVGYYLDLLPMGALYRAASTLLFFHVLVVFLLKSIVLSRFFAGILVPLSPPGSPRWRCAYALSAVAQPVLFCVPSIR